MTLVIPPLFAPRAAASLERLMPRYTLFFLDWDDATVGTMDIECGDDASALVAAADHQGDHADVEVLCGNRTVGRPVSRNAADR